MRFEIYEIATPEPTSRWAGSHGGDSVGIMGTVDQTIIEVETRSRPTRMTVDEQLPLLIHTLHFYAVLTDGQPLLLPQTWTAEHDDRTIQIEGHPVTFVGVSLLPDKLWAGGADIDEARITVTCQGPAAPTALRVCTNLALPDTPPT